MKTNRHKMSSTLKRTVIFQIQKCHCSFTNWVTFGAAYFSQDLMLISLWWLRLHSDNSTLLSSVLPSFCRKGTAQFLWPTQHATPTQLTRRAHFNNGYAILTSAKLYHKNLLKCSLTLTTERKCCSLEQGILILAAFWNHPEISERL